MGQFLARPGKRHRDALLGRATVRQDPSAADGATLPTQPPPCRAPFIALDFDARGNVQACCANALYPLGNIGDDSLMSIWTGRRAELLRDAVSRSDLSLGCTVCRHRLHRDSGAVPADYYHEAFPEARLDAEYPYLLSFSLHNTCNLECVMCGADSSSRIRTRRAGLAPLPHVYGDDFFEELRTFLRHCGAIDFVGGEPFLIREHQRIWDMLMEDHLTPRCSVTTNGTIWNRNVERTLDALDFDVCLSFDGITAETFESIRRGSEFETVMRNLHRFHRSVTARGRSMNLSFSLLQQNWFEFGRVLLFAEDLGLLVTVQTVIEPGFGAQRAGDAELSSIVDGLTDEGAQIRSRLTLNGDVWDRELAKLSAELGSRAAGEDIERIMEPPGPNNHRAVSRLVRTVVSPPAARSSALRLLRRGGSINEALPDRRREELERWTSRPVHHLDLAADLRVVGSDVALGGLAPGIDLTVTLGEELTSLLHGIELQLRSSMWIIEGFRDGDTVTHTLWFGGEHRDKEGLLLRMLTIGREGGASVLLAADDTLMARSGTPVDLDLGRHRVAPVD